MSGKGSAPGKGANQKAYEDNWEKIFGKKDKDQKEYEERKTQRAFERLGNGNT